MKIYLLFLHILSSTGDILHLLSLGLVKDFLLELEMIVNTTAIDSKVAGINMVEVSRNLDERIKDIPSYSDGTRSFPTFKNWS